MVCLNMPLYIVAAFLVLTLVVGLYFSRQKITFREYAVGNKQFATATLVATVLATFFEGGGLMRNVECVYDLGIWWIGIFLLAPFGMWTVSRLASRMGPFMHHLSMADTIGHIYGRYPRGIAALVGICNSIIVITMQITVMSEAIDMCLGSIDPFIITILTTLLLIFYSTFGGVRSVTFTDVFQFLTFSIIIPLLAWFMFVKIGKPVVSIVPILKSQTKFQPSSLLHPITQLVGMLFLFLSDMPSYINPQLMQRVYMAADPIQARRVFSYATIFGVIIQILIISVALFIFVGSPTLPKIEIWHYVMAHIPSVFKGCLAIGLLAMSMSSADSCLNACAVMMTHDMVKVIHRKKEITDTCQLKIARWTTLVVGLLAMMVTFKCRDLLKLMYWSIDSIVPILAAPFILAVFGFRGTSRTALIGMVTGVLTILAWNKLIEPSTGIDGSFVAMLANGLAMLAAHYLFKQPEGTGWVAPDTHFKQMQQAKARRTAERKEAIKNGWANRKATLAKLKPSHTTIVCIGFYLAITSLVTHFIAPVPHNGSWLIVQLMVAAFFIGYPFIDDISKRIRIPTELGWLIVLVVYFPLNLFWNWYHSVDPTFTLSLSLTHFSLILLALPLYLAIAIIAVSLLLTIYPICLGFSYALFCSLLPLLIVGLFLFAIITYLKVRQCGYIAQLLYLKDQEQIRSAQQLKASLYDAALVPSNRAPVAKSYGFVLEQVVRKVEESISFLDKDTPLFKEDFQSIINKFYDWVTYFNKREKVKEHALLQPTQITLDRLMRKVEVALSQEIGNPPRLLVEKIDSAHVEMSPHIICDIHQVVYLLVKAVLRIGRLEGPNAPIVRIQLHSTTLRFKQVNPIDHHLPSFMEFPATALVVSQSTTPSALLPKVQSFYDELDAMDPERPNYAPPSIDLEQDTIASMVHAHYGYLQISTDEKQPTMLLVLPSNVTDIRDKMTVELPIDCLTSEAPVTPQEQADSMMALMKFHDHVCKYVSKEAPIDIKIISGLLLLLRQHFGFKRHSSGQLFYVRAVGIAHIVVDWVFHSPKVIYASLLYGLVRRTCLPLSYIKEHYNLGVYAFVSNVVKIDKREELDAPSLLSVQNRLEKALKEDHVQLSVLFIKLAERLYDLRHASGYTHLTAVQHMAQETLTIDLPIANQYLGPEIGAALEEAAQAALKLCKDRIKNQSN
ncbi:MULTISPECIES: sodium:solute symporter family protein [Candidatus Cardinium]|uniref:sodium:solute symporter family protein n=1 Tax=Candidatus Cardinium TaxID=273135 RepID=UPI001FA98EC0|nr:MULTISPECIES: sodium:solute symporter family protein [Cardinium]